MNTLLCVDSYKLGHLLMYPEDTTEVYSYLEARKPGVKMTFFGLQYIIKEYLMKAPTMEDFKEFLCYYTEILGEVPSKVVEEVGALVELGYWPIQIKAVPEGTIIDSQNVLMTIRSTQSGFHWCVGFLESLLLKLWNPCTVATYSRTYKELVEKFAEETCDDNFHIPFQVHDFGYRGVSSEETAMISGASHLLNFLGSDTISANYFLDKYYNAKGTKKSSSVGASEHSVMCSYGRDGEYKAFDRILFDLYPKGIVSIVSDSYDYWNILTDYIPNNRSKILEREGKFVVRGDSGNPEFIICGDPSAEEGLPERQGSLNILWDIFGGTINSKGYKVLDPHIGLIYGDGMHFQRFHGILENMKQQGFASSNLVIGVGGLLLQNHNRDEFGFAIKATRVIRGGKPIEIFKDPKTDSSKKSKKGLMMLRKDSAGVYSTIDQTSDCYERMGELVTIFRNGELYKEYTFEEIKANGNRSTN